MRRTRPPGRRTRGPWVPGGLLLLVRGQRGERLIDGIECEQRGLVGRGVGVPDRDQVSSLHGGQGLPQRGGHQLLQLGRDGPVALDAVDDDVDVPEVPADLLDGEVLAVHGLGIGGLTGELQVEVLEEVGGVRGGVLAVELTRLGAAHIADPGEGQVPEGAAVLVGDLGGTRLVLFLVLAVLLGDAGGVGVLLAEHAPVTGVGQAEEDHRSERLELGRVELRLHARGHAHDDQVGCGGGHGLVVEFAHGSVRRHLGQGLVRGLGLGVHVVELAGPLAGRSQVRLGLEQRQDRVAAGDDALRIGRDLDRPVLRLERARGARAGLLTGAAVAAASREADRQHRRRADRRRAAHPAQSLNPHRSLPHVCSPGTCPNSVG
ncbi:hypothetical protein RHRU231_750147 [Rhodococcus ruber]|uniref:Uncharacterized protein n=1 Tax=Rhodococcus ruber TaxID=1830 RepID=A0A098BRF9_9NOCA|nr:hypothetical protein RHRU231_750147 [Rhodococcus ruber]